MGSCAFDKLFHKSVPHILETVFFSLDYESYKKCLEVGRTWNELLTSERYLKMGKSVFQDELSEDETKLQIAARAGDAPKVRTLLRSRMLDVNSRNGYINIIHNTPLHEAAKKGHRGVVKLLINRGSDLNAEDKDGDTPLHDAARYGNRRALKILLERGADINKQTCRGSTPLHLAASLGHKKVVELLLKRGAIHDKLNVHGMTPLAVANEYDYPDIAKVLNNHSKKKCL